MKILIVTPRFSPEPFSIGKIAEELSKTNDVTVLTGRPNYGKWRYYDGYEKYKKYEQIGNINVIRVNEKPIKKSKFSLLKNYIRSYFLFKKELKKLENEYDAVLSHGLSPLFCLSYTGKFTKKRHIPNILYGLDLWPESFVASSTFKSGSLPYRILKIYSKYLYKKFDKIIYASPSACDYIKNTLKIDNEYRHIYQPCLTKIPNHDVVSNHVYKKNNKLHILYCGTIAKFIHLDIIIKALNLIKEECDVVFDIVGSGSDEEQIKTLISELKLENVVIMHGRVSSEETIEFYKNTDILFAPLYWNCPTSNMIPQKIIEYFMYCRPILGMIKGDGADLIQKSSKGNIISDQNPESIADAIKNYFSVDNLFLLKTGEENRKFFDKNPRFLLKIVCQELINEINKSLNKN